MATHITKTVAWNDPSIYKYKITLDANFEVTSVVGHIATINISGNYIVDQTEHEQQMVAYPASDYGFLFEGEVIPAAPTTAIPGDHYMEAIPTLFGGSAEQYRSAMLLQFRGDTYSADGGNFTNLWTKSDGLIINRKFGNTSTTVPLNIDVTVDVSDGGRTPVLSWATTYVTFNPTVYHWGDSVAWVSWVDLTWEANLSYDANGGSGAPASQSERVIDTQLSTGFTVPNTTPTWGLYEFLGWSTTKYTDSRTEADVEYRPGDTVTIYKSSPNVTLYAVWRMDYRPGTVYDSSVWQSHNRPVGKCHVYNSSRYLEMRTIGSPTAMGNPPSIYHNGKWYNGANIGKDKE